MFTEVGMKLFKKKQKMTMWHKLFLIASFKIIFLVAIIKPIFFPNFFKNNFKTEESKKDFMIKQMTEDSSQIKINDSGK